MKYIPKQIYFVKNNFLNFKYLQGFAITKYTACSTTLLLRLKEVPVVLQQRSLYPDKLGYASRKATFWLYSDTLRERLHFGFNFMNYLTFKIILV